MDSKKDKNQRIPEKILKKRRVSRRNVMIMCPQNGYVYLHADTPASFIGVGTTGMTRCCYIMAVDQSFQHIFFIHADNLTALNDLNHGLPAWLNCIWNTVGYNLDQMRVYVGERAGEFYDQQVREIVTQFENRYRCQSRGTRVGIINRSFSWSVYVKRRDPDTLVPSVPNNVTESDRIFSLGYETMRAVVSFISRYPGTRSRPPFCYFDGMHFLSVEEIKAQYPVELRQYFDSTPPVSREEMGILPSLDDRLSIDAEIPLGSPVPSSIRDQEDDFEAFSSDFEDDVSDDACLSFGDSFDSWHSSDEDKPSDSFGSVQLR